MNNITNIARFRLLYFTEQKITKDVLQMLSEEMITELIPVIGPRAIFLSYWRKTEKKIVAFRRFRCIKNKEKRKFKFV